MKLKLFEGNCEFLLLLRSIKFSRLSCVGVRQNLGGALVGSIIFRFGRDAKNCFCAELFRC